MESSSDHSQQRGPAQNPGGQESGSAYQGAGQPQKIVIEQPGGWFGRLGKLLWIALLISLLFNISQYASRQSYYATEANLQEKFYSGSQTAGDKIAILSLEGVIAEGNGFLKRQIDQVRKDDSVKALVLRVNSPGGTVAGSDYLYHHLKKLIQERELPLVVSMGPVCASGGYYISMAVGDQANSIFAEPTTATGSIGVVIPHYDLSGLLASWDVQDDSIVSHKHKLMGSPTRQLSPAAEEEEHKLLQELVDHMFARFKEIVRSGRPKLAEQDEKWEKVTTGRIFIGEQAQELGLVDRIGFVEDAIQRVAELANLDPETVRIVEYQKMPTLWDAVTGQSKMQGFGNLSLEQLLDLTAPRAYYLSTWLPTVLSSDRP